MTTAPVTPETAAWPAPPREAGSRGTTQIRDRAVARIATQAVTELGQAAGHVKVAASVRGESATLRLHMNVRYPAPVREVAAQVREYLLHRVRELTGLTVRNVDIEVDHLVPIQRSAP